MSPTKFARNLCEFREIAIYSPRTNRREERRGRERREGRRGREETHRHRWTGHFFYLLLDERDKCQIIFRKGRAKVGEITGYIITTYRVTEEQYAYVCSMTAGLNERTRRLFCHILASTLLKLSGVGEGMWVPVASELIKAKLRGASWQALEKRGLIEATGYSIAAHRSREYQVVGRVIDGFTEITRGLPAEEVVRLRCVNLFTGRAIRAADKNTLCDDSGNALPQLFREAVETIHNNGALFNLKHVEAHIRSLEATREQGESERSRWLNDHLCFQYVLSQGPKQITDELWWYPPAYRPTVSGRASHVGGGFQSCSKAMKAAAFSGVPELHNFDLEASQINGLIQLLEMAGLDSTWLITYRDTANNKAVYSQRAGMSVDCWKKSLLAICMGGTVPKRLKNLDLRENSVIGFVRDECDGDVAQMVLTLQNFLKVIAPLAEVLSKWHDWLIDSFVPSTKKAGRGGWYVENRMARKLNVTALFQNYPIWQIKSKLAAFLLQGQEAAFIKTLTILGAKYGFRPIADEHDGLIVIGNIPDEAVEEAARLSGLQNAKLVEKPFALVARQGATA